MSIRFPENPNTYYDLLNQPKFDNHPLCTPRACQVATANRNCTLAPGLLSVAGKCGVLAGKGGGGMQLAEVAGTEQEESGAAAANMMGEVSGQQSEIQSAALPQDSAGGRCPFLGSWLPVLGTWGA